jgi:hypothetical protein
LGELALAAARRHRTARFYESVAFWEHPAAFCGDAGLFTADFAISRDVIDHLVENVPFYSYKR